jgi:alkylation response protein AidB-like acyl-CoA dehydrogenase
MDLSLTPEETQFRDAVRAWLKANVPPAWTHSLKDPESKRAHRDYLRAWQRKLFDGGWAGLSWPKEHGGRGATIIEQSIFQEELAMVGAPDRLGVIGEGLVGPTIISVGTEAQKQQFLKPMLMGDHIWCQGFSEPNAGSDLASLNTRAVIDGDHYVVNGQKIWTSFGHVANWCMLIVRTDPTAPKHKGLTCLLVDMKSPGVTVRPLKMMTGDSEFNELFFTDVRVPVANVLGAVNEGWGVALTALGNERANLGTPLYLMFKRDFDLLLARAKTIHRHGRPITEDPIVRQKLAQAHLELEVFRLNSLRTLSGMSNAHAPGPEGSILKLFWSEMNQRNTQLYLEVLGLAGQSWDFDEGRWGFNYLRARGNTIEAGTSEIQRNIIAQRVLGLPRSY